MSNDQVLGSWSLGLQIPEALGSEDAHRLVTDFHSNSTSANAHGCWARPRGGASRELQHSNQLQFGLPRKSTQCSYDPVIRSYNPMRSMDKQAEEDGVVDFGARQS